jgi:nitroreductase
MDLARRRSSVRRFDPDRSISDDDVHAILEAARAAPSAENSQPWRFIVMRSPAAREKLSRECFSGIFTPTRFASKAPLIIALCAHRAKIPERLGEAVLRTALYQLDCGIAGEHLVLAAADLGIGSCWIGWFDKRKARRVLEVPAHVEVVCLIVFGYPMQGLPERRKVREPLSTIASLDVWGGPLPFLGGSQGTEK